MSPWTNSKPGGLLRVGFDGGEVGAVAGVGQLVEDGDLRAVAAGEPVADEARADEAGPAGDQEPGEARRPGLGHDVGLAGGPGRRPARDSCSASSAARMSEVTVPASVQRPSNRRAKSLPGR